MTSKPRPSSVVYFVRCELNGLVKIGIAENLERRLAGLKAQSPVPLELLATIPAESYELEAALHRRFAEYRHHGEWFEVSDGLDDLIESLRDGHDRMTKGDARHGMGGEG
jgi:hypothetical protein